MKSISVRLDDFLDRYFHFIILFLAFFIWQKHKANAAAAADAQFGESLFGGDSVEVTEAKKVAATMPKANAAEHGKLAEFTKMPVAVTEQQKKAKEVLDRNTANKNLADWAQRLKKACFPSGFANNAMPDGTDEDAIYSVFHMLKAYQKTYPKLYSFTPLAQAYRDAYKRELRRDLEAELSAAEVGKLTQL